MDALHLILGKQTKKMLTSSIKLSLWALKQEQLNNSIKSEIYFFFFLIILLFYGNIKDILSLILIFIIHFLDIIQMMQDLKILSKQQVKQML